MFGQVHASASPRNRRKEVVKELEQQQQADAKAAELIRDCILVGNRKILNSLAKLLASYIPGRMFTQAERKLFQTVSPNLSLDGWLLVREQYLECATKLKTCRREQAMAQSSYEGHSPHGFISRWGQDEAGQRISRALKSDNDRLKSDLAILEARNLSIEGTLKERAEAFMRSAVTRESIEYISISDCLIQCEVKTALSDMSCSVNALWKAHAEKQIDSLSRISQATSSMLQHYRGVTTNLLR